MSVRRLLPSALAVAALALVAALGGPTAQAAPRLGFMDPSYQAQHPPAFWSDARTLRPQVLRYNVIWPDVAPRRPTDARNPADRAYRWADLDALVRDAHAHGVQVLLTVWQIPSWAARYPGYRGIEGVPRLTDWGNFLAALARRYAGGYDPDGAKGPLAALPRVARWELWNEPNYYLYPQRQGGGRITVARDYAQMVNRGYRELKAVHSTNLVAAGSLAPVKPWRPALAPVAFLGMLRAEHARFDAVSIHPYNQDPALGIRDGAGSPGPNIRAGNFEVFVRALTRLYGGAKRIWITEYGLQTYPDRRLGATPTTQAQFLADAVRLFRTRYRRVDMLVWFLIRDEPITAARPGSWQSGLRTANGARKPSFGVWVGMARTLPPILLP